MAAVKAQVKKGLDQSEVLASIFASVILIAIVVIYGHWQHFEFWFTAVWLVGLAYLASSIPDNLRSWRWAFIAIGYFSPGFIEWYFNSGEIGSSVFIFFLALFWLPFIRAYRNPVKFYFS